MTHDAWSRAQHLAISRANRRADAEQTRRQRRASLALQWANRYADSDAARARLRLRIRAACLTAEDVEPLFRSERRNNGYPEKDKRCQVIR